MEAPQNRTKLTGEENRIFELNMIKLNFLLPAMMLTAEERFMLEELLRTYFHNEPPPQLPWIKKSHDLKNHAALRKATKNNRVVKEA